LPAGGKGVANFRLVTKDSVFWISLSCATKLPQAVREARGKRLAWLGGKHSWTKTLYQVKGRIVSTRSWTIPKGAIFLLVPEYSWAFFIASVEKPDMSMQGQLGWPVPQSVPSVNSARQ
jgi:hypothetical protein